MSDHRPNRLYDWQAPGLFGTAYYVLAWLGHLLSVPAFSYVTFWLPAGLYTGVLLLYETRSWPRFILVATAANLLFDLPLATPPGVAFGYCCANTSEAVAGAWLLRRFVVARPTLAGFREFFGLLACAALLGPALGTTIAAATLTLAGRSHSFWGTWITWWGNEAISILLVTPLMLAWLARSEPSAKWLPPPARLLEALLLTLAIIAGTGYLLVFDLGINAPYKSRLFLLILWAGLRFGLRGVTAANLLLALLLELFTNHFQVGLSAAQIASGNYVAILQSFVLVCVLVSLLPTIAIADRNRKMAALQESEERFRLLTDNLPESMVYQVILEADGTMRFLHVSPGIQRLNGLSIEAALRDYSLFYNQILEADRPLLLLAREETVKNLGVFKVDVRIRRADGALRWMNLCSSPRRLPDGRTVWEGIETDITARHQAESDLKQSEERFSRMFQNSPIPVSLIRQADGVFLDVNESFVTMSGFSRAEILGRTALGLNMYPDPACRAYIMERIQNEGRLHGHEQLFRAKSGKIRTHLLWFEVIAVNGESCLLVLGLDITEQKQAEARLRDREQQYHSLFEHMLGGLILVEVLLDKDGKPVDHRLLEANSGFDQMTGLKRSEEIGRTSATLSFQWPPEVTRRYYEIALGAAPVHLERYNDSLRRWYDVRVFSPRKGQFAMVFYDITSRRLAETSQVRLATVVEQTSESIIITDTEGTVIYVNPAFEKTTGYAAAEILGQNPRLLKSGRQNPAFYSHMWDVLQQGEIWQGRLINRRKDGTLFEEEATISPVRDASGKIVNYVAIKRDVTREVELEAQFRQAQKMEAVGLLASGVAHDFNNILNVIQLQASLLKHEADTSPRQRDVVGSIENSVQRAASLIRQLLLFSRKQALNPADLDLNEIVRNMAQMLQRALGETVQMRFHPCPQPLPVHADAGTLEQTLLNLTVNARDAMPQGGRLTIETAIVEFDGTTAAATAQARPGVFACLSVTDTGAGIPPAILPRIFDPFFTTKDVGKGTGLGLATVFGIVQQHLGWINVTSEIGSGTSFRIYLPCLSRPPARPAAEAAPAPARGGDETILLVEDDADVRGILRTILARLGYHILEADCGVAALEVWRTHRPEIRLLLTDLMMPGGLTGRDLAEQLLRQNPELKVIYASGYSAELASQDFPLEEGVNFLAKPFTAHKLAQIVRDCLDKK